MRKKFKFKHILWKRLIRIWNNAIKPVFLIYIHDLKAIKKNLAAIVIVTGLCLIPSLYAWINIYACWDPYSNTGNLPVAIVNKDEGAVLGGKIVNVGDSIIESMKENKAMNWNFVDEWQGSYGLNEGKYYALIEIPENFSSRLTSLSTSTPQKPVLIYRVNEKLNAIAAKITNVAKEKLVANIKSNFVKTVNEEVIQTFNSEKAKSNIGKIEFSDMKASVAKAQNDISRLKEHVSKEKLNEVEFQKYLNTTNALLPGITEQITSLGNVIEASKSLNSKTIRTIESISTDLNNDMVQVDYLNNQNQQLISKLQAINSNTTGADMIGIMKESIRITDNIHALISADQENLSILNKNNQYSSLTLIGNTLSYTDKLVLEEKRKLEALIPIKNKDRSNEQFNTALDNLSKQSEEVSKRIQVLSNAVYATGLPSLTNMANDVNSRLDDKSNVVDSIKMIIPQLSALSTFLNSTSQLTVNQRTQFNDRLNLLQKDVATLLDKMDSISNEHFTNLLDLIENNPTELTDFLASPLEVKVEELYNVKTLGEGLTPFYTVLAIWVGALLLCAMLTVECENYMNGIKLNLVHKHFGKMLLFLTLSLIQSTIVTLGDVYILGVAPVNFKLMMQFSVLSSVTFTVIIFTLVSLLGNVGKAIAVVIMVFQIAGAGGIYPIQTNPEIFGRLLPLWPFTYAINGFREAIAGPVWNTVAFNIKALFCFIIAFLLLAILKKPLNRMNMFFEHKFKETEL